MRDPVVMDFTGVNGETIVSLFERCSDPAPALEDFGGYKQRQIVENMPPRGPLVASPPGEPPGQHSSSFAQSITFNVEGSKLEVGSADPRAGVLQEGGVIPAQDKLLTIPLSEESYGKRASDFPDAILAFRRTAAGLVAFLVQQETKIVRTAMSNRRGTLTERGGRQIRVKQVESEPTFLFVLKQSVLIEEHPYLEWLEHRSD